MLEKREADAPPPPQREERLSNGAKPESVRPSPPEMWSRASHMLLAVAALHSKILSVLGAALGQGAGLWLGQGEEGL